MRLIQNQADRHEQVADVHQHALVGEEDRPRNGISDSTGIVSVGSSAVEPVADRPSPRTRARPVPEEREGQPGHDLVGPEVDASRRRGAG